MLTTGAVLAVLSSVFVWWGGPAARAVRPSLLVSFVPLLLPMLIVAAFTGDACSQCAMGVAAQNLCLIACVSGGVAAGAVVGLRAARLSEGRLRFVAAACVLVSVGGSMGCGLLGTAGVLGLIGGLALGSVPALLPRAARR